MFDININMMVVVVMANIDAPASGLSSDCKVATACHWSEDDLDINVIFPSDHLLPLGTS